MVHSAFHHIDNYKLVNSAMRSKLLSFVLSFSLLSSTLITLAFTSSCNRDTAILTNAKAESIVNKYLEEQKGEIVDLQGVLQDHASSQAEATLEVAGFQYRELNNSSETYSGKAQATFVRYTNGQWVMTRFTVNPDDLFAMSWLDTHVIEPTARERIDHWLGQPAFRFNNGTTLVRGYFAFIGIPCTGIAALIVLNLVQNKKQKA